MKRQDNTRIDINGIILLDKPIGISSNRALQQVKGILRARKAGHTGSLDPLATGLLIICLGAATKFSGYLLDTDKSYRAVIQLGVKTNTGDAEGEIVEKKSVGILPIEKLEKVLAQFVGKIQQIPPMYSAIKYKGTPLYKLARRGLTIERKPRDVTITKLELLDYVNERIKVSIHCSKGTYIRTLAEDIGDVIGCGASIQSLERTSVGPFNAKNMVTIDFLQSLANSGTDDYLDKVVLPIENAFLNWPNIDLTEDATHYMRKGQPVFVARSAQHQWVKLFDHHRQFIGVGQVLEDGKVAPRRLVSSNT